MRLAVFIILTCHSFNIVCQILDSIPATFPEIVFAKREFFSRTVIKEKKFGRSAYSFNPTFFMDKNLKLNNRNYVSIGLLYYKLEKYCRHNAISYNKNELNIYRRKAVVAGTLFGIAGFGFLPIYFNALNYSNRTGYNEWPNVLFRGKLWLVLWALPVVETILASKLKAKAERRLRNKMFLDDGYKE